MIFSEHKKIQYFYFAIILCSLIFFSVRILNNREKLFVIDGDGRGYYSYLPAVFFQHDLSWSKLHEYCSEDRQSFLNEINGKKINKYSFGTSLLMLPFFLLAILFSIVVQENVDGNNFIFHLFIACAAIFYFLAGIYFAIKSLLILKKKDSSIIYSVTAIILGTSILFYTFFECSLSHIYSFFCMSGFGFFTLKFLKETNKKIMLLAGLFLFLIIVIRPFNIIVLASLPFLIFEAEKIKIDFYFFRKLVICLLYTIVFALMLLVIFNYLQSGLFILNVYKNEGFNFFNPEFVNFLFSARKGLFFYSPILFLAFICIVVLAIKKQVKYVFLLSFFLFLFYLLSSWWNWFYGDSFGQRVIVDFYYFFLFPLTSFFEIVFTSIKRKLIFGFAISFLLVVNLVQTWQIANGILPLDGMNWEKYNYIFLKTNKIYAGLIGEELVPIYGLAVEPNLFYLEEKFNSKKNSFGQSSIINDSIGQNNKITLIESQNEFSLMTNYQIKESKKYSRIYVSVEFDYFDKTVLDAKNIGIVFSVNSSKDKLLYYYSAMIMDLPNVSGKWHHRNLSAEIKQNLHDGNSLNVYFYNPKGYELLIDNYKLVIQGFK